MNVISGARMRAPAGPIMIGPGPAHMCAGQTYFLFRIDAQRCILATSLPARWMHWL